uniref:Sulfotransferase n=1 Tax=Anolis carolinensis TaxID=28377 RepID=A0A803TK15_ANOCA
MAKETSGFVEFVEKFFEGHKDNKDELLFSFRGVLYPTSVCNAEAFEALVTMEARKDDILITAYPKFHLCLSTCVNKTICLLMIVFNFYSRIISSWDEFFQKFMNGEGTSEVFLLALFKGLVRNLNNLYEGIKQIAEFYAFPLSEEKIKFLASNATFQGMSDRSSETHGSVASVIFRKGEVGDWKTLFTEAQSKEMDAKFEECLAATKLGRKLRYDKYCKF